MPCGRRLPECAVELNTASRRKREVKVSPDVSNEYVGAYQMAPGTYITTALSGDHLGGQLTGQETMPLFAEAKEKFFPNSRQRGASVCQGFQRKGI